MSILAFTVAAAACSRTSQTGHAAPAAAAATSRSTPAAPDPSIPVPQVLWGTWEPTTPPTGDGNLLLNLVFSAHSFAFYDNDISNAAIGRAWGNGSNEVVFGIRGPCNVAGTYQWAVTGGLLKLSGGADDTCQRHDPLVTRTWKKASDNTQPADTDATQ